MNLWRITMRMFKSFHGNGLFDRVDLDSTVEWGGLSVCTSSVSFVFVYFYYSVLFLLGRSPTDLTMCYQSDQVFLLVQLLAGILLPRHSA